MSKSSVDLKTFTGSSRPEHTRVFYVPFPDGTKWSGATDGRTIILIKGFDTAVLYAGDADRIRAWIVAEPSGSVELGREMVLAWSGPITEDEDRPGVILGTQVDRNRLTKVLGVFSSSVVSLWEARQVVGIPCLALVDGEGVKAFIAGYAGVDADAPVLPGTEVGQVPAVEPEATLEAAAREDFVSVSQLLTERQEKEGGEKHRWPWEVLDDELVD